MDGDGQNTATVFVVVVHDGQQRRAFGLNDGVETPETAGEREVGRRSSGAGIVLADGAADGKNAAGAGAAAAAILDQSTE